MRWGGRNKSGQKGEGGSRPWGGEGMLGGDSGGQLAEHGARGRSGRSFWQLFILRTRGSHFSVSNIAKT